MDGKQLKEIGMESAREGRSILLKKAREIAESLAATSPGRKVNSDMVRQAMGEEYNGLGPAAGSVFRGSQWSFTGERVVSTHPANHSDEIKVWRLKQ